MHTTAHKAPHCARHFVNRYACLVAGLLTGWAVYYGHWAKLDTLLQEAELLRPHWPVRVAPPPPDLLNYSRWIPAPNLREGCCKHLDPLVCCTAPYNGTVPRPMAFGSPAVPLNTTFLAEALRGRRVALIGDSIMRQAATTLVCALDAVAAPILAGRPAGTPGGLPCDFRATYADKTTISRLDMPRYHSTTLQLALARADLAVVNVGAWYNTPHRSQYERDVREIGAALAAFNVRPGRWGVLLDTVPQHFPTELGSGAFSDRQVGDRCVPVDPGRYVTLGADWHTAAMRSAAQRYGIPLVEVADIFLPRWDAHLEKRPKTPTSGSGRLDCTHYCHRDSLWHPLLARLARALRLKPGRPGRA